jgi:hypothetical protein
MTGTRIYQDDFLNSLVHPNWKNESEEVLKNKAFNEGFKKGFDAKELAFKNFFSLNLDKATELAEFLFKSFESLNFKCNHLMLKPLDLRSFEFLFIVDEDIYLSPARKEVYKLIRKTKKESNSQEFRFECLIMPQSEKINFDLIISEGFSLKYEPKTR